MWALSGVQRPAGVSRGQDWGGGDAAGAQEEAVRSHQEEDRCRDREKPGPNNLWTQLPKPRLSDCVSPSLPEDRGTWVSIPCG